MCEVGGLRGVGDLCGVTTVLVLRSSKIFSSPFTAEEEHCGEGVTTPVGLECDEEVSVFLEERGGGGGGVSFEVWSLKKEGSSLTAKKIKCTFNLHGLGHVACL